MDNSKVQRENCPEPSRVFHDLLHATNNESKEYSCKWRIFNSNCPVDKLSEGELQFRKLGIVFKKEYGSKNCTSQLKTLGMHQVLDKNEFQNPVDQDNQNCFDWDKFLDKWEGISMNSDSASREQDHKYKNAEKLQACLPENSVSNDIKEKESTRNPPSSVLSIEQITNRDQIDKSLVIKKLKLMSCKKWLEKFLQEYSSKPDQQYKTAKKLKVCLPENSVSIGTKESMRNSPSSILSIEQITKRKVIENLEPIKAKLSLCRKLMEGVCEEYSKQDLQYKTVEKVQIYLPGNSASMVTKEKVSSKNPPSSALSIEKVTKPDQIDENLEMKILKLRLCGKWLSKLHQECCSMQYQQYKTAENLQVCRPENSVSNGTKEKESMRNSPSSVLSIEQITKPEQIDESLEIKTLKLRLCRKWLEDFHQDICSKHDQQYKTAKKLKVCLPENSVSIGTKESTRNSPSILPDEQITKRDKDDKSIEAILRLKLKVNLCMKWFEKLCKERESKQKLVLSSFENEMKMRVYPVPKDIYEVNGTSRLEKLLENTKLKLFEKVELPPLTEELLSMDPACLPKGIEDTSRMDIRNLIKLLGKTN